MANQSVTPLTRDEIVKITQGQIAGKIWRVEQEPQGAQEGSRRTLVFIKSNLRDSGGVCLASSYVFEVVQKSGAWTVSNKDEGTKVSVGSCSNAGSTTFVDVDPGIPEALIIASVLEVRELLKGSTSREVPVTFQSPQLKVALKEASFEHLAFVSRQPNENVEFQFAIKSLMPQFLGVRLTFERTHVVGIFVNEENGVDVVPKDGKR